MYLVPLYVCIRYVDAKYGTLTHLALQKTIDNNSFTVFIPVNLLHHSVTALYCYDSLFAVH